MEKWELNQICTGDANQDKTKKGCNETLPLRTEDIYLELKEIDGIIKSGFYCDCPFCESITKIEATLIPTEIRQIITTKYKEENQIKQEEKPYEIRKTKHNKRGKKVFI